MKEVLESTFRIVFDELQTCTSHVVKTALTCVPNIPVIAVQMSVINGVGLIVLDFKMFDRGCGALWKLH